MEDHERSKFPKFGVITVILVTGLSVFALSVLLERTGKSGTRRAELCRSIVPALHLEQAPVEMIATELDDEGDIVRIAYRLEAKGRAGRRRWMACTFRHDESAFGEPVLESIETDTGTLGEGRLFVIKRWWLEHQGLLDSFGARQGTLDRVAA